MSASEKYGTVLVPKLHDTCHNLCQFLDSVIRSTTCVLCNQYGWICNPDGKKNMIVIFTSIGVNRIDPGCYKTQQITKKHRSKSFPSPGQPFLRQRYKLQTKQAKHNTATKSYTATIFCCGSSFLDAKWEKILHRDDVLSQKCFLGHSEAPLLDASPSSDRGGKVRHKLNPFTTHPVEALHYAILV